MMPKRITLSYKQAYLNKRRIELIEDGGTVTNNSRFKCRICDYEWSATFHNIKNHNSGCPKCAGRLKTSEDEAIKFCASIGVELVSWSGASDRPSKFKCKKDGYIWSTRFEQIKNKGTRCPKCSKRISLTMEEAQQICNEKNILLEEYAGTTCGISRFKCKVDNYVWTARLTDIKSKQKRGCPRCIGSATWTVEDLNALLCRRNLVIVEYAGTVTKKSKFRCLKCDNCFKNSVNNVKDKLQGCPKCAKRWFCNSVTFDSSWELIFYLYHVSLGNNPIRLEGFQQEHCFPYLFGDTVRKWYPDFLVTGKYYEIKPDKGNVKRKNDKEICLAKKAAHPDIIWVGDAAISEMRKVVGDISQYRR